MMRLTTLVAALTSLAAPILAQSGNLHFTGPDPAQKLNLSAPITVSWVVPPNSSEADFTQLDLRWGAGDFRYDLFKNISLAVGVGSYLWDPSNQTSSLLRANYTLTRDKDYFFEAHAHNAADGFGPVVRSEKYAVEGYPLMGAGPLVRPGVGMAALAAMVAAGMYVL